VDLTPLTLVFLTDDVSLDPIERNRHAIVLDVPQGARIRFDESFDLAKLKVGRMQEGKLRGPVTIRRHGRSPRGDDDLDIATRDVDLSQQCVSTPYVVDFRLGPHYGRGRDMEIKLLPREGAPAGAAGLDVGGIEQLTVHHIQRLHVELGQAGGSGQAGGTAQAGGLPGGLPGGMAGGMPVEIACRGPFQFNLVAQVATFRDQVDVLGLRTPGPNDRLTCDVLSIFFTRAISLAGSVGPHAAAHHDSTMDLKPQKIEAVGTPATLSSPTDKIQVRAERLQYDLTNGAVVLEDRHELQVQQDAKELHARTLHYEPATPGHLGRLLSQGPGWLRGEMAGRTGQPIEARWNEQLQIRPQGPNQVVSLTGGAGLKSAATGQLDAREIHFWLLELPVAGTTDRTRLQPDRMLARGEVRAESPQLSSAVDELQVWFEPGPPAAAGSAATAAEKTAAAGPSPADKSATAPGGDGAPPPRQQHFEILGRLLHARVLLHDQQPGELLELKVEDKVRFTETQTALASDRPLLVTGDRLHVTDANRPETTVVVTGRPAHVEGRGLGLTGTNINVRRSENLAWIDGPGQMDVPLNQDMEGRPLSNPSMLRVDWRGKMKFDGRKTHFEDTVTASGTSQQLHTQILDVWFDQPVVFGERPSQPPPRVQQIQCRGGVLMENRSLDAAGQQASYDRMSVADLACQMDSGALTAGGPGWAVSVRRGTAGMPLPGPGGPPGGPSRAASFPLAGFSPASPATAGDPSQLTCVHLRFLGSITGNIHRREITFHDEVHAARAAVTAWQATLDSDDPETLGPQAVVLRCDHLTTTDMGPVTGGGSAMELLALGNVITEGNDFTARANRMTYAQAKDLLIFEGDGRTDSELIRQEHVGSSASKFSAQKIFFWPQLNQVKVEGVRSFELNQYPNGEVKKGAKPPPFLGR
jgi:hypothetical protein